MKVNDSIKKGIGSMKAAGIPLHTQVITMTKSTAENLLEELYGVSFHIIDNDNKFIIKSKGDKE